MLRKLITSVTTIALASTLFASTSLADTKKNENSKPSLIALGDSITFGLNLDNNQHPSKDAFPSIIGSEEDYRVRNLAVSGDQTEDLLNLLETSKYQQAIQHADFITLNIGSNDYLKGARSIIDKIITNQQPDQSDLLLLASINQKFSENLNQIIGSIRNLTDAPIVLYTIYNPIYGFDLQALQLFGHANMTIKSYESDSIYIADAFAAFAGKQNLYIIPGDIHPNPAGQAILAQLAIDSIQ